MSRARIPSVFHPNKTRPSQSRRVAHLAQTVRQLRDNQSKAVPQNDARRRATREMFESILADALNKALGEYCVGIDTEKLRVSAWRGDVLLKNVQLKRTALASLRAPIALDAGTIGELRLKIPWRNLGKEAVIVEIDRVFVLASRVELDEFATANASDESRDKGAKSDEEREEERAKRAERVARAEFDWLKASMGKLKKKIESEVDKKKSKPWIWSLVSTAIANVQVKVTNVHFRYEDDITTPGHRFTSGMTVSQLSAITVDDAGKPTFTTSDMLSRIHKHVTLAKFSVYLDSDNLSERWKSSEQWKPPEPSDEAGLWALFGPGIDDESSASQRHYILHPVTVDLIYHKKGRKEVSVPGQARQIFDLRFQDARVALSREQYYNMMRLLDVLNQHRMRLPHAQFRPRVSIKSSPKAWWNYAKLALVARQKKILGRMEWREIAESGRRRREYVSLYIAEGGAEDSELRRRFEEIEHELDFEVALAWRCIAHSLTKVLPMDTNGSSSLAMMSRARVQEALSAEVAKQSSKRSFLPWRWSSKSDEKREGENEMTDEDWSKLDALVGSNASDEDSDATGSGIEFKGSLEFVSLELKDTDEHGTEHVLMSSSMRGAHVSSKSNDEEASVSLTIDAWTCESQGSAILVSAGHGSFSHALEVRHQTYTLEHELDASFDVHIAPVYVTFERQVVEQITSFFRSTEMPIADLTSLQDEAAIKLARAKESTTAALKKVAMNFEIDAPKVTIPVRRDGEVVFQTLVDFGHFTFIADPCVKSGNVDPRSGAAVYHAFSIKASEMAIFNADKSFDWMNAREEILNDVCDPLVGRCQAQMQFTFNAPGWTPAAGPRTCIEVESKEFQVYVSPARLARLYATMQTITNASSLSRIKETAEESVDVKPWHGALLSGGANAMKVGLVGSASGYHNRWLCVKGPYVYVLERPSAQKYIDYLRIGSNVRVSVFDPKPEDDEKTSIIAIHDAKVPKSRALDATSTWLFRFTEENELSKWQRWLQDLNDTALAKGPVATADVAINMEQNVTEMDRDVESEEVCAVDLSFKMILAGVKVHLFGQHMGKQAFKTDGFENGGVARALTRGLKDSTEAPIATLISSNTCIAMTSSEMSREFALTMSNVDIVDEMCETTEAMYVMKASSATEASDVRLKYIQLNASAPTYKNIDTTLALETDNVVLTIHRPTIGSLWRMWEEIKIVLATFANTDNSVMERSSSFSDLVDDSDRIGFQLLLNFKSTVIRTFWEQVSGEATLRPLFDCDMDDLQLEMAAKSSGLELSTSLGNLRVVDQTVPLDSPYRYFFDLKSDGTAEKSRTHVDVYMYNHLSPKFPGFEYDIRVKCDDVKVTVVFAFIKKVLGFFTMFLPPPIPVSALPEAERQAEVLRRGEPRPFTMVYSCDMKHPELIVPRNSASSQALLLDAAQLLIANSLDWTVGKSHRDLGSVLLDTTTLSFIDCSARIRNQGNHSSIVPEKNMAFDVVLRKPKWDADNRSPGTEMMINFLNDVALEISDVDYRLLRALASENFTESSEVPERLYEAPAALETLRSLHSDANTAMAPNLLVSLNADRMKMTILTSSRPIASFQLEKMYVIYSRNDDGRFRIGVSCPNLELSDLRLRTPRHARRVFGSSAGSQSMKTLFQVDLCVEESIVECSTLLQSCRMMYDPQFGLALYNFFTRSSEDESDVGLVNARIKQDVHFGAETKISFDRDLELSSSCRLLFDSPDGSKDVEICGNGHEIVFHISTSKLILIASGRTIRFKDVRLVLPIGTDLSDYVQLESDSHLVAEESDGVHFVQENRSMQDLSAILMGQSASQRDVHVKASFPGTELIFLDVTQDNVDYMLRMRTDAEMEYSITKAIKSASVNLTQFQVSVSEWGDSSSIYDSSVIIKPMDVDARVKATHDDVEMILRSTDADMVLDAQSIERVVSIVKGFKTTLQSTGLYKQTISCSKFHRVGGDSQGIFFWRPIAPIGFSILGDCVTMTPTPPSRPVVVITDAEGLTKLPLRYERACAYASHQPGEMPTVWWPIAPDGYCALGCIVTSSEGEPPLTAMRCVRNEVVRASDYGGFINQRGVGAHLRHVKNSSSTFHVFAQGLKPVVPIDLRAPLMPERLKTTVKNSFSLAMDETASPSPLLKTITVYDCVRVWVSPDGFGNRRVSIWRPRPPPGYFTLGDCLVNGPEPPQSGVLVAQADGDILLPPNGYVVVGLLPRDRSANDDRDICAIWRPLPPQGYVACGDVITLDHAAPPPLTACACIREDFAARVSLNGTCANVAQAAFDAKFVQTPLWIDNPRDVRSALWSSDPDAPLEHLPVWGLFQFSNRGDLAPTQHRPRFSVVDYLQDSAGAFASKTNVSLKLSLPRMSLILLEKEAYSNPLLLAKVSDAIFVVHGTPLRLGGNTMFTGSIQSYNTVQSAWEPVIDATNAYLKFSYSVSGDENAPAGVAVLVKTISPLCVSVSHSFLASMKRWNTWRIDRIRREVHAEKVLRSTDDDVSRYENQMVNQDIYVRVGSSEVKCLRPGEACEIQREAQNLAKYKLPIEEGQVLRGSDEEMPFRPSWSATVRLLSSQLSGANDFAHIKANLEFSFPNGLDAVDVHTRAVAPEGASGSIVWNEEFNITPRVTGEGKLESWREHIEEILVTLTLSDEHRISAGGTTIASRSLTLNALLHNVLQLDADGTSATGTIKIPCVSGEDTLDVQASFQFHDVSVVRSASHVDKHEDENRTHVAFSPDGPWKTIHENASNTSQVVVGSSSRCIFSSVAPNSYVFKSAASFYNNTVNTIELCVCPSGMHPDDATNAQRKKSKLVIEEIFENQRFVPLAGWSSKHLFPTERKRWCDARGSNSTSSIEEATARQLPPGHEWKGQWEVNIGNHCDKDGWAYAANMPDLKYPFNSGHKSGPLSFVRMRRWIRAHQSTEREPERQLTQQQSMSLRQRMIVKPQETVGLIPSIIGTDAQSELFIRTITSNGPSAWGVGLDEGNEEQLWSCNISGVIEDTQITRVIDATGVRRYVSVQIEGNAVSTGEALTQNGTDEGTMVEGGFLNFDPDAMSWRIIAGAPHVLVNQSPRTVSLTLFQGTLGSPLSVTSVSEATITPWSSLPVHTVHPSMPYYVRVGLDDDLTSTVPSNRLVPISPTAIQAIVAANTLDTFEAFDMPFGSSHESNDVDEVTFASADGRTASLAIRHDFGTSAFAARTTTLSASMIVVNRTGVDLVIRTSTAEALRDKDDELVMPVKFTQTMPVATTNGIELLRDCAIRNAPKDGEVLMIEIGVADSGRARLQLSPGIPIDERELVRGTVVVRAVCGDSTVYTLAVRMESLANNSSSQLVVIEPRCTITNQTGSELLIVQDAAPESTAQKLQEHDVNVPVRMQALENDGCVRVKIPGAPWTAPIDLYSLKTNAVKVPVYTSAHPDQFQLLSLQADLSTLGISRVSLSVEHRSQANILVENSSDVDVIAFRQAGAVSDELEPWRVVMPRSAKSFAWSRPLDAQRLNLVVVRKGSIDGCIHRTYDFDSVDITVKEESLPGLPVPKIDLRTVENLDVDGGDSVYFNFLPVMRLQRREVCVLQVKSYESSVMVPRTQKVVGMRGKAPVTLRAKLLISDCSFALIDRASSEIVNLSANGVAFECLTGTADGISSLGLVVKTIQIDDMNVGSQFPVVLRLLNNGDAPQDFLAMKIVTKSSVDLDARLIPYMDVTFARQSVQVALYEPLLWRLVNFARVFEKQASHTAFTQQIERANVPISMGSFHVSELNLRLRFRSAAYSRPKHMIPAFLVGVSFVNIDDAHLSLEPFIVEDVNALERAFWSMVKGSYTRQIARQALLIIAGVDVLDSFSQALGQASAGLAGLSLDKKFSSSMKRTIGPDGQKADSIKSGITEGSEMLAKGVFRGVTGVFQKPIEGAMKGGAMGFAKGVGKGLIGAVTQPLSGGLAAVGRTAEGIAVGLDSVKTTLGVNALAPQVRVRHPRAEHADGVLRSFESNSARAHYILRTAERGSLAGGSHQVFTRKGYYSRDKYISSLDANSKTTLIVLTDQRVVMLKRVSPTEEKYVALWHCVWSELLHVEVQPPSNVVLHLKEYSKKKRVFEKKRISRVIETTPATQQSRVLMLMISEEIKRHSSSRSKIEEEDGAESGGADELPTMLPCANWKCVAQSGSTCFWAPVPPLDKYAPLGHVVAGSAPPIDPVNVILRRGGPDISASPPVSFELIYRDASNFTVWMPVPPPGFRALGAIVVSSAEAPSLDQVACVRADYLTASSFDDDPSWTADVRSNESMRRSDRVHFENVSMWSVDNVGRTFIAARSRDCPSDRYALDIVDIFADDE